MIKGHHTEVSRQPVQMEGAENVSIQWLIGKEALQAPFFMRRFEVEPGGHTPYHRHMGEHVIYVLEGSGEIRTESGPVPLIPGSFALIEKDEMHGFNNSGSVPLVFLCLIPRD